MLRLTSYLMGAVILFSTSYLHGKPTTTEKATFAGGCFWCLQKPFDNVKGVVRTSVGYTHGKTNNPTYEQVSGGQSGHIEALQIEYNPSKVSYEQLLKLFWINVDPFDNGGQFCDRGYQYTTAIFTHNANQKAVAQKSLTDIQKRFSSKIVTPIHNATRFYNAEDYHQKYYEKNPVRYKYYRWNCGRDKRLAQIWGK